MNNPLNLSGSELLSAYLDGELSPQSEKQLFEKLASSDELRSEMRDFLAIHKEIEAGTTYYPPAALKTASMARVGLDAGVGTAGLFKSAIPYMKSAFAPVASALVGSLMTVAVFMNMAPYSDFFKKENSAENTFTNEGVIPPENKTVIRSEGTESGAEGQRTEMGSRLHSNDNYKISSREFITQNGRFRASQKDKYNSRFFTDNDLLKIPSSEQNSLINTITEIPEDTFLKERFVVTSFKNSDTPKSLKEAFQTVEDKFTDEGILSEKASWLDNMQFEIRGFSLANYPQPRTLPQSDPIFKNMAGGVYYMLNDEHALGAEFGQEAFSQRFNGIEEDTTVNYQQYLILPWTGMSYRWTPDIPFKNIRPLGGITLAGTTGGPVGRAILGVKLFPDNPVSMMLAAEGAVFAYQYQNAMFTSPKFGIMYGVSVKF